MDLRSRDSRKAFTVLELLVAVSVTALLAGMLLNITSQVVKTQTQASGNLETNQVAQFVLDRIQEDLQCAVYRNDGNIWMAADILDSTDNSGNWISSSIEKPKDESFRIKINDWPENLTTATDEVNQQGLLTDSRYGIGGTWLRFFTNAPELDPQAENTGANRAIAYQIIRYGLTSSETSTPRYQLFRSDVSGQNTLEAGFNLDSVEGAYANSSNNGPRESGNLQNPIFIREDGTKSTAFSLAGNIVDFGIRAYLIRNRAQGTGYLQQIFPDTNSSDNSYIYKATNHPKYHDDPQKKHLHSFPDVIDVMVRVLTSEGSTALAAFEDGLIPSPGDKTDQEYWWDLVEQNSEVYVRRIRIFSKGI